MTIFESSFEYAVGNEDSQKSGIVTDEPPIYGTDPTNPTGPKIIIERPVARFGINSHAHPEAVKDGFYTMPVDQAFAYAKALFKRVYWDGIPQLDSLTDWGIGAKVLDISINAGYVEAKILLTRALAVANKALLDVTYNELMPLLIQQEKTFYNGLYNAHPEKYAKVLAGWLARADKLPRPVTA